MLIKKVFGKFMIFGLMGMSAMLYSCGSEEVDPNDGGIVIDDDYYEFQDFNLGDYDIPAFISLPDETANIGASTKPEIIHIEDDIKWEVNVGQNFQLMIEDYGDLTDLIEVEKKELAEQSFFKVNYIIDEPDMILYERTLLVKGTKKASSKVGVEHRTYHVYGQKIIDGISYELQSREDGYEKVIIELMAKSIKSMKPKKK
ncbi:MAG: hypothetical protein NWQ27_06240 [Crocinitomicaceae bacterium]|jgi:hypothetical protein|nr:hypothetical protein [Crocinitomicaceae bacterium]